MFLNDWIRKISDRRPQVYRTIDFLPVWNFFRVVETNDTRYIFKLRNYETIHTRHTAVEEWSAILEQYFTESIGVKYYQYRSIKVHILELRQKHLILSNALTVLCVMRDQRMIDLVKKFGYKFNDSSDSDYADSLIALDSQLKGLRKAIELKQKDYENTFMIKGKVQDVYDMVSAIEQFKGFKVDAFTLTVKQFLTYQKELYKESIKYKTKQLREYVKR